VTNRKLLKKRWHLNFLLAFFLAAWFQPSLAYCFAEASQRYGLNIEVLKAIAIQESSMRPQASRRNTNGTEDRGLMGINSVHWPQLERFGISAEALFDPCTNVMVGAFLLAGHVRRVGATWNAVGDYHSRTPSLSTAYRDRIYRRWLALSMGRDPAERTGRPQDWISVGVPQGPGAWTVAKTH
jgi:soluble lytic murein transglycosylase-like protein